MRVRKPPKTQGNRPNRKHRRRRGKGGPGFAASFIHWRSGKRIYAKDYNLTAFPIGR